MMRKRLLAASALWLLTLPASGQQVDDVVVFGDSLSDPGNISGLSAGVNFPPIPPCADNRFTNGPVYSELLPGLLGGTFDPSLDVAAKASASLPEDQIPDLVLSSAETAATSIRSSPAQWCDAHLIDFDRPCLDRWYAARFEEVKV